MEITQVIVAYRNPFEMWLWESGAIWLMPLFVAIIFTISFFATRNNKR